MIGLFFIGIVVTVIVMAILNSSVEGRDPLRPGSKTASSSHRVQNFAQNLNVAQNIGAQYYISNNDIRG